MAQHYEFPQNIRYAVYDCGARDFLPIEYVGLEDARDAIAYYLNPCLPHEIIRIGCERFELLLKKSRSLHGTTR